MTYDIFVELGLITIVALSISGIMAFFRQPLIIGYILSGILLGPNFLNITRSSDAISTFAQMGVIFLLFLVGIGLNPKVIKDVGKVSLITGLGQIIFTSAVGFAIASILGFNPVAAIYIAVALTFSSTIIIMKIISDKEDNDSVYGRIAIGFLIVQDIVAMIILLLTSSFSQGGSSIDLTVINILIKIAIALIFVGIFGVYLLPKIMTLAARSQELLLLSSIGWCLVVAVFFHKLNFSIEIGALIAGILLANSPYRFEIASKLKPLRDFFIFMFFVLLGSQMVLGNIGEMIIPIIVFSLFILVGNPVIVMILMGYLGYTKKSSFLAGLTVAQISEFSLIYIALGIKVGHIESNVLPLVTIVGLITIAGSTYLMMYSNQIYRLLSKYLVIFERKGKKVDELKYHEGNEFDVILFGYNRMGKAIQKSLSKMKVKYLIVDYNPEVIENLSTRGVDCRYGDVGDTEILDELNLCSAQMVISTVKDFDTNSLLIKKVRSRNKNIIIITVSNQEEEALELYKRGSTYVVLPHHLGGHHAAMMIEDFGFNLNRFIKEKNKHSKQLMVVSQ